MVTPEMTALEDFSFHSALPARSEAIALIAFTEDAGLPVPPQPADEDVARQTVVHRFGSIAAVVSFVSAADYCDGEAERRLGDLGWLAPRLRHHAEVVEWAMQCSPVFPAPFGTLYSSVANLSAFMRAHETKIAAFLRKVAEKDEWELQGGVRFDRPDLLDQLASRHWRGWHDLSRGMRYMRLCRDRDQLVALGRSEAVAFMRECVAELRPFAADIRQHDVCRQGPDAGEAVIRHALLIAKADIATVRRCVDEIAARAVGHDISIALRGPWPPFSFRPDLEAP